MTRPDNRDVFIPSDPQLFEVLAIEMRTKLMDYFTWLDQAYLIAERRIETNTSNTQTVFPGLLAGNAEYINALPDAHKLNYSYFEIDNPTDIDWSRTRAQITHEVGLIFFFNYKALYPADWRTSTIERVKSDVLRFFHATSFAAGQVRPLSFDVTADAIYANYDHDEANQQFLMKPWGALRINLEVKYFQKCP